MQYSSRNSPSSPDAYPPPINPVMYSSDHDQSMGAPRPLRTSSANSSMHSSTGDDYDIGGGRSHGGQHVQGQPGSGPYAYGHSNPSLPRYQSQQQLPSPLNPSATRQGYSRDANGSSYSSSSRFSSYNNGPQPGPHQPGAHPLSNTMYMDSSPTLAGSEVMSPSDEKMRLGASDSLGEYIQPIGQRDTNLHATSNNNAYRARGPLKATGFTALYRAWSGANLADSGKDERHIKLPRLGYLDGLKFIAAWVVLNGTLFDATIEDNDYSVIQKGSPLYSTRSVQLLPSRVRSRIALWASFSQPRSKQNKD